MTQYDVFKKLCRVGSVGDGPARLMVRDRFSFAVPDALRNIWNNKINLAPTCRLHSAGISKYSSGQTQSGFYSLDLSHPAVDLNQWRQLWFWRRALLMFRRAVVVSEADASDV
jgi:hypothetical protein